MEAMIKLGGGQFEWTKAGKGQNKSRKKSVWQLRPFSVSCQEMANCRRQQQKTQTVPWWNRMTRLTRFHQTTSEVRKNGGRSIEQEEEDESNKKRRKANECRKEKMMSCEDDGEVSTLKEENIDRGVGGRKKRRGKRSRGEKRGEKQKREKEMQRVRGTREKKKKKKRFKRENGKGKGRRHGSTGRTKPKRRTQERM